MLSLPGMKLGDIGEKIALNAMDNGFLMFNHHSISRNCLLNKYGDVTPDGKYVSAIKNDNQRFGKS